MKWLYRLLLTILNPTLVCLGVSLSNLSPCVRCRQACFTNTYLLSSVVIAIATPGAGETVVCHGSRREPPSPAPAPHSALRPRAVPLAPFERGRVHQLDQRGRSGV
jgi:hypothetical protein